MGKSEPWEEQKKESEGVLKGYEDYDLEIRVYSQTSGMSREVTEFNLMKRPGLVWIMAQK